MSSYWHERYWAEGFWHTRYWWGRLAEGIFIRSRIVIKKIANRALRAVSGITSSKTTAQGDIIAPSQNTRSKR